MIEYRKIIGFGKSSFVISLPKEWIARHKLTKGSTVTVTEENDTIVITPAREGKVGRLTESYAIESKGKSDKLLQREITSAYISGYHSIIISGDDLKKRSECISQAFKNLVALEIVKQDEQSIIARDFLDINEIDLPDIIRKIDNNLRSMFIEADELYARLEKGPLSQQEHATYLRIVQDRDDAINKLAFLSFRTIKSMLKNPSKTRDSMIDLFQSWTMVLNIERSGDELKRLYRESSTIEGSHALRKATSELYEIYKQIMRIYHGTKPKSKTRSYELAEVCRQYQRERKAQLSSLDESLRVPSERLMNIASNLEEILRLTYDFM